MKTSVLLFRKQICRPFSSTRAPSKIWGKGARNRGGGGRHFHFSRNHSGCPRAWACHLGGLLGGGIPGAHVLCTDLGGSHTPLNSPALPTLQNALVSGEGSNLFNLGAARKEGEKAVENSSLSFAALLRGSPLPPTLPRPLFPQPKAQDFDSPANGKESLQAQRPRFLTCRNPRAVACQPRVQLLRCPVEVCVEAVMQPKMGERRKG